MQWVPVKNIVHIVDNLARINFGIWNAAVFGSGFLQRQHGIKSMLWVCHDLVSENVSKVSVPVVFLGRKSLSHRALQELLQEHQLEATTTVFVSHGCWGRPTKLGYMLKQLGFNWIYTPHGMLEPWSMNQKKIKKQVYFKLFEKRWSRHANVIRAVSDTERLNLQKRYSRSVVLIENGIKIPDEIIKDKTGYIYLFMARLHHKKGILPLVLAWNRIMSRELNAKLIIAGPDEGELEKIKPHFNSTIEYTGPIYGSEKEALLKRSHYYFLPSFSEGFPTSVVEAMSFGLIPLISEGCNFLAVFKQSLGYQIEPNEESIAQALANLKTYEFDVERSFRNRQFIINHNSEEVIGDQLWTLYQSVISLQSDKTVYA